MPILKGATKKLRQAGIEKITIQAGLWGPYLYDPRLRKQTSKVYKNWQAAVKAALVGERPKIG